MDVRLSRAVQAIQASKYSLETIRRLQESGFDLAQLSGEIVCQLVARNFGLGLKILLSCGVKLDCVSTNSVLSLLLARGHASCGCLEKLLQRLSHVRPTSPPQPCNRVILPVGDLMEQIKTTAIDRVAGVFRLWISANFIDLQDGVAESEARRQINELFLRRTVGAVVKDCLSGWTNPQVIRASTWKCIQLLFKLLVLGRLGWDFLDECQREVEAVYSIDRPKPLDATQIRQLEKLQEGVDKLLDIFGPLAPLKLLTILCIRRQLQRAMQSALVAGSNKTSTEFIFHRQIEELDLPLYLTPMILLQDDIHL